MVRTTSRRLSARTKYARRKIRVILATFFMSSTSVVILNMFFMFSTILSRFIWGFIGSPEKMGPICRNPTAMATIEIPTMKGRTSLIHVVADLLSSRNTVSIVISPRESTSKLDCMKARSSSAMKPLMKTMMAKAPTRITIVFMSRERATCPFFRASRRRLGVASSVFSWLLDSNMLFLPPHAAKGG